MDKNNEKDYSKKHDQSLKPDPLIENEIKKRVKDEIFCITAFEIAKDIDVSLIEIGKTLDLLNIPLAKCQLGLFGHKPNKKTVESENTENQDLINSIKSAMVNNRLSCSEAFKIAHEYNKSKIRINNICQANKIKIKPCQLGAFKN